jgi:Uncharacterized conserved protein (DUF2285)
MAFVVDLEQPLDRQFIRILKIAERDQERLAKADFIKVETSRNRDNYVGYLRLLDARDSGASPMAIKEKLFPGLDGAYGNDQQRTKFNNDRKAAEKLRDGGYKALAARGV